MLNPLNIENLKLIGSRKNRTRCGHLIPTTIRARKILKILERDNYRCVKCGNTKELTIDHINGRKFAKWNNAQKYQLDKCQTLCIRCHLIKNGEIKDVQYVSS